MIRFMKLLNFEVSRFIIIFSFMMGTVVGCQFVAAYLKVKVYLDNTHRTMRNNSLTYEEFAKEYGKFDLSVILGSTTFIAPILFIIAVLVIYVFYIWYRDWFGKATFSYRLMILPTNRINVYFAKLLVLLLFIFVALAVEVAIIYSLTAWVPKLIPVEIYNALSMKALFINDIFFLVLPTSFKLFLFNYVLGITAVCIVFTMILFERSFRLKGIVFAILFALLSVAIILLPAIYQDFTSMLYYNELYISMFVISLLTCGLSITTANYLLKHKINV